jgi:hypothetical protein
LSDLVPGAPVQDEGVLVVRHVSPLPGVPAGGAAQENPASPHSASLLHRQ